MPNTKLRPRPAARWLILDSLDRVLLFCFTHKDAEDALAGQVYWGTPGGAVDPGETIAEAALRELLEETGIVAADAGPEIGRHDFPMQLTTGEWVEAQEHYFTLRVAMDAAISQAGWSEAEAAVMGAHRWWSVADIRATKERVYPETLLALLERC